jgi:hypothetical protein
VLGPHGTVRPVPVAELLIETVAFVSKYANSFRDVFLGVAWLDDIALYFSEQKRSFGLGVAEVRSTSSLARGRVFACLGLLVAGTEEDRVDHSHLDLLAAS